MKPKSQKKEELKKLKEKLPKSSIIVFTTFARAGEKGLSVAQFQELKRALRALGSEYTTAKKTILDIALKDLKLQGADVYGMAGSIGLVFGPPAGGDAYAVAKKLYEFAKKNQALQFFGALMAGGFVDKTHLSEMALLPSREVLLARLFGMMRYPLSALAITLKQIGEKKGATV